MLFISTIIKFIKAIKNDRAAKTTINISYICITSLLKGMAIPAAHTQLIELYISYYIIECEC
jgi:hypothetical protein